MRIVSVGGGGGGGGGRRDKRLPPGFRFHPTDEELVLYYLKRKIRRKRLRLNPIAEIDVYKFDPEELPGLSILKTGDRQWFFFSPRDRKYPNGGTRTSRGTRSGYWKATGKDRTITCNPRHVGVKKTLVFYRGRAPSGQRTDWVMHEYTLHQDELNRCQNALDYYALYKVFKKSGPGPKNGEQYGAPFREEEWADDDDEPTTSFACPVGQSVTSIQLDEVPSADKTAVDGLIQSPLAEIDEFLNSILDEPESNQMHIGSSAYTSSQVASEEDTQSAMVYSSSEGINCPDTVRALIQTDNQCNELANTDFTHTAPPTSHFPEASVVTSAINDFEPEFFVPEEDFLEFDDLIGPEPASSSIEKHSEDFLEFDDLVGLEPTFSSVENPADSLTVEDYTGLNELDMYHDAAMFLNDMGSVDQENLSQPCMTFLENNESGGPNYQMQPQYNDVHQSDSQLWAHDQQNNAFTSAGTINGTDNNPTSGVVYGSISSENQDPSQKDFQGSATSQISSAIWAFLDSIPTTPASAAENALVNQAFVRMSSFSRLRVNSINNNIAIAKKAGGSKKLVLVSIIGIACAVSWVLVGSMDIWGRNSSL